MAYFRWNAWNVEHIALHGVGIEEAEYVVHHGERRRIGDGKYKAVGQGPDGRWLQAIYIFDPPGVTYVIHARPLTAAEKRRARRQQ